MSSGSGIRKKTYSFLFIISAVLLTLLLSCGTSISTVPDREPTQEEANQALHMALDTAKQNADYVFYNEIKNTDFLPDNYSRLVELKDSIPGMEKMIDDWNNYICEFIYSHINDFYTFVNTRKNKMVFSRPLEYVRISDSSASELFIRLYLGEIMEFWNLCISEIDDSAVDKMLNQLKNWDVTQNLIYNTEIIEPENTDIHSFLVEKIVGMYLSTLASEEELFRTTPDPYGDAIAKLVFKTY